MRNCPDGHGKLTTQIRQGIEIDFCPSCRGVWLDRGELDKIVEGSGGVMQPANEREAPAPQNVPGRALQLSELFDF